MGNIDKELSEKYTEIFGSEDEKKQYQEEIPSPLFNKIQEINIQQFVKDTYIPVAEERKWVGPFYNFPRQQIVDDMWNFWFDILPGSIRGKHFCIPNKKGYKTVIYRIVPRINYDNKSWYNDLEELISVTEEAQEINVQTFFLDDPAVEGEQLVILHFASLEGNVYVNMGEFKNDKLLISKKPLMIHMTEQKIDRFQNRSQYADELSDHCHVTIYDADADAEVYIFDHTTGEPVVRERYWDEKEQNYKYKIKMEYGKSYFTFQVRYKNTNHYYLKLTDLEIGKCYREGRFRFPVDEYEALKYLEKTCSAEADYHIAEIFLRGNNIKNSEFGFEYLKKSADAGYHPACVELALYYYFSDKSNEYIEIAKNYIESAARDGFGPALFIKAYCYEKGIIEKDIEYAFKLYYCAAQRGFLPALYRLASNDLSSTDDSDEMYALFIKSAEIESEYADFCLGMMLFHDNYVSWKDFDSHHIEPFEEEGFQILLKAALVGCKEAVYQVALAYYFGLGVKRDRGKAFSWFASIKDDPRIYYGQSLCILSQKKEGFDLHEIEIFQNAADIDTDGIICVELGLNSQSKMEYEKAVKYFHMSIDRGNASAYYHLAKMYSEYYKVVDEDIVHELYEMGAANGNELCKNELKIYHKNMEEKDVLTDQLLRNVSQSLDSLNHKLHEMEEKAEDSLGVLSYAMESIDEKLDEVNERAKDVQVELRNLSTFVKEDLTRFIKEQKEQLSQQIQDDFEKKELQITEVCHCISGYINDNAILCSKTLLEREKKYLKSVFGEAWDRLENESRTSLISAGVLWKMCVGIEGDFDYSGICISATTALESELKKYFFTGFQNYINDTYGAPSDHKDKWKETFDNWPEILLSTTKEKYISDWNRFKCGKGEKPHIRMKEHKHFALGTMPFIFAVIEEGSAEQHELLINRLEEYLSTIIYVPENKSAREVFISRDKGKSFIDKCDRIRKEYRNRAAHDDIISEEQAKGCYHEVVGKIESYEYTSDVTGLLLQLCQHIK